MGHRWRWAARRESFRSPQRPQDLLPLGVALAIYVFTGTAVAVAAIDRSDDRSAALALGACAVAGLAAAVWTGAHWRGPVARLIGTAAIGSCLVSFSSLAAWPSDPGTQECPGTQPCDTAFGLGAILLAGALCLPMIIAALLGRAVAGRRGRSRL
jgi:hypothetical protein